MYARSTTFTARAHHIDPGVAHINREVLPALETMPGFVGLSLLADRESGRCILTTAWDGEDAMHASAEAVRPIRDRTAAVFDGPASVQEWQILAMHRAHHVAAGTWVRSTWLKLEPDRFKPALEFCKTSVLPAIEEFEGFCSASVLADVGSRRAVISASYDSAEALDHTRESARSLRTARLRQLGADQLDVGEFELAIARLRVPEMV
ncbi:MAG: hypothetical protein ACOYBX_00775 [Mycobacterium sp.]|jgi:heme-degrading monooxygenase HmoA